MSIQALVGAVVRSSIHLIFLVFTLTSHAGTPFTTDGNFSVGNDGSANYSIPIQVPPGTAGMAPTLSLNYNSNGGNGMLGMGWGIDGLSQISRCPQTLVQDGQIRGVKYDANDKLCLDGQRLISTGGTYGANGTEYRTEQANFARIISYTSDISNGPDSFKVWTKAGQVIEYGNTADSRIEAAGKTVIRSWATNKISDTKGNYISVSYTEDNANGEAYVNRIDYTGNSNTGLAPYANVQFEYEDRPDISIAYQAGSIIKSTKRMASIKTYVNNTTLVKDYRLTYEQSQATQRSRLKVLAECHELSTCKTPVTISWNNSNDGWVASSAYNIPNMLTIDGVGDVGRLVDLNGDGLPDYVYARYVSGQTYKAAYMNTGSGWVASSAYNIPNMLTIDGVGDVGRLVDLNGDGLPDYVYARYVSGQTYKAAYMNTGSGWVASSAYNIPNMLTIDGVGDVGRLVDLNGDGLPDYVYARYVSGQTYKAAYMNTGSGWVASSAYNIPNMLTIDGVGDVGRLVDLNGDGLPDYVYARYVSGQTYKAAYMNTGSGWVASSAYNIPNMLTIDGVGDVGRLVDLNGDGLPDYVYARYVSGQTYKAAYMNTGSGWVASSAYNIPNMLTIDGVGDVGRLVDLNGDGLPDYVYARYVSGQTYKAAYMNTGSGWVASSAYNIPNMLTIDGVGDVGRLVDLNGDGLPDYVYARYVSGQTYKAAYKNLSARDQLTTLTPGLSSTISLSYKPITDSSVYVKGAAGASGTTECPFPVGEDGTTNSYPILNLQAPMYVVSSASVSDGNSGTLTNTYQYGGLKAHVKGRGSLGFRYQQVTQTDADINSTTFFRQDYPYIGLPCQTEKRVTSTNTLIGASALSYANAPKSEGSATSQFPYLTQSVEQSFELDGSLINTTTKTNQFDDYGNATQIGVDSGDGYTKTTNNECYNDTSNGKWLLGRLLRSTVTSTSPDTAPTLPGGGGGTTTPPPTSTSWTHCANEWSWCGFWGETKTVRFGVGNQWVEGSFTDGVNCNGGSFGGVDPAPGTAKTCEIADTTTTPPPAANASPTISLAAGSSTATQGDNISLTATASDSDGTITQVTFYDGANLIGTDSSAPYSLTWTTDTNTTTGTHNLTAKATDDGGAEGNSGVVAVTLNAATPLPPANVAPSVSITNPPNGISVPGPVDVQITADASDSDGTIAEVAFYANGNLLGTDTTAPYAVDVTGVQAGNYTVTATATDDDGATTSVSVQVTVN